LGAFLDPADPACEVSSIQKADVNFNSSSNFSDLGATFAQVAHGGHEVLYEDSRSFAGTDPETISEPGLQKGDAGEGFGAFAGPAAVAEADFRPFAGAPTQVGVTAGYSEAVHVPAISDPVPGPGDFGPSSQSRMAGQREGPEDGLFLSHDAKPSAAPGFALPSGAQLPTPSDVAGSADVKIFVEGTGTEDGDDGGFGAFSESQVKKIDASSFSSFVEPNQAEGVGHQGFTHPVEHATTDFGAFVGNGGGDISSAFQDFSAAPEGAQSPPAAPEFAAFTSPPMKTTLAAPDDFGEFTTPASSDSLYPDVKSSAVSAPSGQFHAPTWPAAPSESFGDFVSPIGGAFVSDGNLPPEEPSQEPDPASLFADLTPMKGAGGL
jgi:hypothetical protein